MTYDLIDDRGEVLFRNYPFSDAKAEQEWRWMCGLPSVQIIPHGKAKEYYQLLRPLSQPPYDL